MGQLSEWMTHFTQSCASLRRPTSGDCPVVLKLGHRVLGLSWGELSWSQNPKTRPRQPSSAPRSDGLCHATGPNSLVGVHFGCSNLREWASGLSFEGGPRWSKAHAFFGGLHQFDEGTRRACGSCLACEGGVFHRSVGHGGPRRCVDHGLPLSCFPTWMPSAGLDCHIRASAWGFGCPRRRSVMLGRCSGPGHLLNKRPFVVLCAWRWDAWTWSDEKNSGSCHVGETKTIKGLEPKQRSWRTQVTSRTAWFSTTTMDCGRSSNFFT